MLISFHWHFIPTSIHLPRTFLLGRTFPGPNPTHSHPPTQARHTIMVEKRNAPTAALCSTDSDSGPPAGVNYSQRQLLQAHPWVNVLLLSPFLLPSYFEDRKGRTSAMMPAPSVAAPAAGSPPTRSLCLIAENSARSRRRSCSGEEKPMACAWARSVQGQRPAGRGLGAPVSTQNKRKTWRDWLALAWKASVARWAWHGEQPKSVAAASPDKNDPFMLHECSSGILQARETSPM